MTRHLSKLVLLGATAALLPACGGLSSSSTTGGSSALMTLQDVTNGFGQLVPYSIRKLGPTGAPSEQIISIRSFADLSENLRLDNEVLPPPQFPTTATLPSGVAGNHFIAMRFTQDIDIASVLDPSPGGQANSGLTGAINVVAVDPITGDSLPVLGRAFVGGMTFAGVPTGSPPTLTLQTWVELDGGKPAASIPEGLGFPGTQADFNNSDSLVSPDTLVFVVDTDGNLATHETFPANRQVRIRATSAVLATNGESLDRTVLGSSTVGPDLLSPEVLSTPPPLNAPLISPGNNDINVDPMTMIRIEFTEPVQPLSVGPLAVASNPGTSDSVSVKFGPPTLRTNVPFNVQPISIFDLSVYQLVPGFAFPGSGPSGNECGTFSVIDIEVIASQQGDPKLRDLAANQDPSPNNDGLVSNGNLFGAMTAFTTGDGPGLVNAPIAPDVIYLGRLDPLPGISIIDLNGFGQGTGNPTFDIDNPIVEGNSNFPNNPNLSQATLVPGLQAGECTINGGSAGVFTLTKDSSLEDLVIRSPLVTAVNDMMIGQPLDRTFNNAAVFGCQAGAGNICASNGFKVLSYGLQNNTVSPPLAGTTNAAQVTGAPNIISWVPHPNPPPIVFPPLCLSPFLAGQEPTSIDNVAPVFGVPPGGVFISNLLSPGGNPLGTPALGLPPDGLLTPEQNLWFVGPSLPSFGPVPACTPFQIRQQIGQFLYVLDRQRGEVTVLNSNRMTVIDRILVPDPTSMAMGPNLDILAVTNQQADTVTFIDIDPISATFHQAIKSIVVGDSPRGIAWQPDNEDILVCNENSNTISVISAFSLEVRNIVSSQLNRPFEIALTPRQWGVGLNRGVYFGYILNRTGTVALYESGPNGVNGWGFDDVIGIAPGDFRNPKTIQNDHINYAGGVWIVHEGPIDPFTGAPSVGNETEGAVSNLRIESGAGGLLVLGGVPGANPQFRDLELGVGVSIGQETLSGVPVDIAFDNQRNVAAYPNPLIPVEIEFAAGAPATVNGKNLYRLSPTMGAINANEPQFMFVAIPNSDVGSGVVDVIRISSAGLPRFDTNPFQPGIQSIPAARVNVVADYWRQ